MNDAREDAGFTLIEVLVALAILAISLAALMSVLATGLDRQRRVRNESEGLALAQSLMAEAQAITPLLPGDSNGTFPDGFTWRREIAPYGAAAERQAWSADAMRITVTVSWPNGSRMLTSLRVVPRGAPP